MVSTLVGSPIRDRELARTTEWNDVVERVKSRVAASEKLIERAQVTIATSEELCGLTDELAEALEVARKVMTPSIVELELFSRRANFPFDGQVAFRRFDVS